MDGRSHYLSDALIALARRRPACYKSFAHIGGDSLFIGELVKLVSKATGTAEATVALFARVLREAGFLTTGARGVNAPHMTTMDAARLLLAMMVTEKPSRAVEAVQDFGTLRCFETEVAKDGSEFTLGAARHVAANHTFEEAIAALIDIYARDADQPYFEAARPSLAPGSGIEWVPVCNVKVKLFQLSASISMGGAHYIYSDPDLEDSDAHFTKANKYKTNIRVEKDVMADVIHAIAFGLSKPTAED